MFQIELCLRKVLHSFLEAHEFFLEKRHKYTVLNFYCTFLFLSLKRPSNTIFLTQEPSHRVSLSYTMNSHGIYIKKIISYRKHYRQSIG
jgi:hypothetical protein